MPDNFMLLIDSRDILSSETEYNYTYNGWLGSNNDTTVTTVTFRRSVVVDRSNLTDKELRLVGKDGCTVLMSSLTSEEYEELPEELKKNTILQFRPAMWMEFAQD